MNKRHQQFIAEYLANGMNATQAYVKVYKAKNVQSAGVCAHNLLKNLKVAGHIGETVAKQVEATGISAEKVLREYDIIASGDLRDFYDEAGNLKPMKDWTAEMGKRVAAIETVIKNVAAGDGQTDTIHKIKLWPKDRALEGLAKHLGLLTERVELTASDELLARLDAWKGRNRT